MSASRRIVHPSAVRAAAAALALLTAWAVPAPGPFGPGTALGQPPPETMPASLLRRLGEAADAHRTGQAIWLVADPNVPHDVAGVFPSSDSAAAHPLIAQGYRVYGPYLTPVDLELPTVRVVGCVHSTYPSPSAFGPVGAPRRPMVPMGLTPALCPMRAIPIDSISTMRLVVETLGGVLEIPLSPRRVDAVIFSVSAFDKFVAPYYSRLYGPAYAQAMRDSLAAFMQR